MFVAIDLFEYNWTIIDHLLYELLQTDLSTINLCHEQVY